MQLIYLRFLRLIIDLSRIDAADQSPADHWSISDSGSWSISNWSLINLWHMQLINLQFGWSLILHQSVWTILIEHNFPWYVNMYIYITVKYSISQRKSFAERIQLLGEHGYEYLMLIHPSISKIIREFVYITRTLRRFRIQTLSFQL